MSHPYTAYWDKGVANVPDMTGARHLLDGRDLVDICAALSVSLPLTRVLDIGCGTGRLSKFCDGYTGVDISPSMVEYCQARGLAASLVSGPADYPTGPFDWVTAISVCTHIDRAERWQLLEACARLASRAIIDIIPGDGRGDVALWTADPAEFVSDATAAGWRVVTHYPKAWDMHLHDYYRLERS